MKLTSAQRQTLLALWEAQEIDFATLVDIAGLNPARDFRGANLEGVQFGHADLTGYDFTSANLRDADLRNAKASNAVFDGAIMEGATLPQSIAGRRRLTWTDADGLRYYQRDAVRLVLDRLQAGHHRAAVVMAQGTGKHLTMVTLLRALAENGELQSVLVLTSTKVAAAEIERTLRHNAPGTGDHGSPLMLATAKGPVPIMVSTVTGVEKRFKRELSQPLSHVVYFDTEGAGHVSDRLNEDSVDRREIAFLSGRPSTKLADWSNHVVLIYEGAQAVADGFLLPVEIHHRADILAGRGVSAEGGAPTRPDDAQLRRAVQDVLASIQRESRGTLTAVICDHTADCKKVAAMAESEILLQKWRGGQQDTGPYAFVMDVSTPQRALPPTVRLIASTWEQLSPHLADQWDDLVLLGLRRPPRRLGGWDVIFRPARPERTRLRVHDYVGAATMALSSAYSTPPVSPQPNIMEPAE